MTTQQARDLIANRRARGEITTDEAHAELDKLESEIIASDRAETEDEPDWAEAAKALEGLQEHLDSKPLTFGGVPVVADPDYPEDRAPMLVSKPACFQPRTGLKHDVVAEMNALTQRCLREAGMVSR